MVNLIAPGTLAQKIGALLVVSHRFDGEKYATAVAKPQQRCLETYFHWLDCCVVSAWTHVSSSRLIPPPSLYTRACVHFIDYCTVAFSQANLKSAK